MENFLLSLSSQTLGRYSVWIIGPYTLRGKDGTEIDCWVLLVGTVHYDLNGSKSSQWFKLISDS
jgi:hypothetical protein